MSIVYNQKKASDLVVGGRHMREAWINGEKIWPDYTEPIPPPTNPDDKNSNWWVYGSAEGPSSIYDGYYPLTPDLYVGEAGKTGATGAIWRKNPLVTNDDFRISVHTHSAKRGGICILLSDKITGVRPWDYDTGGDRGAVFSPNTVGIYPYLLGVENGQYVAQTGILSGNPSKFIARVRRSEPPSTSNFRDILEILYVNGKLTVLKDHDEMVSAKVKLPRRVYLGFTGSSTYYGAGNAISWQYPWP